MPLQLSHVAEELVAALINRARPAFLHRVGLLEEVDWDWVTDHRVEIAIPHVPLAPYGGRRFDGAHTIDVLVMVNETQAVPVELKLGETGLGSARFAQWMSPCRTSHGDTAWAGTMMSIMDRRFPPGTADAALLARVGLREVELTARWVLMTRRSVRFDEAHLGPRARRLAIEDLAEDAGGPMVFNEAVRRLLSVDFHRAWLPDGDAGPG